PVPLEEGTLRLEHRDPVAERLDRAEGEPFQPADVVRQPPAGQQRGVRVDADAERATRGHRPPQLDAETRSTEAGAVARADAGHRDTSASAVRTSVIRAETDSACSAAACSCNEATRTGSLRAASIACTAAANCCTVVMIGRSIDVVAARIS